MYIYIYVINIKTLLVSQRRDARIIDANINFHSSVEMRQYSSNILTRDKRNDISDFLLTVSQY